MGVPALVNSRFALRAGFPTTMHPEPLIGILAHNVFNSLSEQCRIGRDIGSVVAVSGAAADQI